jgi:TRAP-type C4-dicarboxylate transport system permease small subunit
MKNTDRNLSAIILLSLVVITILQIVLRSVFNIPMVGIDELARYFFIAFIFFGLPYYFRTDGHIQLLGIKKYLLPKRAFAMDIIIQASGTLVFAIIAFSAIYTTFTNYDSTTPTLSIPFWLFFLPAIVGFCWLTFEHIKVLYTRVKAGV